MRSVVPACTAAAAAAAVEALRGRMSCLMRSSARLAPRLTSSSHRNQSTLAGPYRRLLALVAGSWSNGTLVRVQRRRWWRWVARVSDRWRWPSNELLSCLSGQPGRLTELCRGAAGRSTDRCSVDNIHRWTVSPPARIYRQIFLLRLPPWSLQPDCRHGTAMGRTACVQSDNITGVKNAEH